MKIVFTDEEREGKVIGGVDTHADTHWLCVLGERGDVRLSQEFPATAAGYDELARAIGPSDGCLAVGVEGTGSFGAGLTRRLSELGYRVYEVLRPKREKRGIAEDKNDGADAERAARDVMAGHGLSEPKPQDGWVEGVRVLLNARDQAVKACTSLSNAARSMLITADESMRRPYEGMAADKLMKSLMRVEGVGDIGGATADALKVLAATGRICANAKYVGLGFTPWSGTTGPTHRQYLTKVTFAADMATYSYLNLIYCFYSCTNLASVVGLSNLRGVRSLRYAFSSCAFTSIDFRGFDPSTLTDLFYTFSGCSSLATIYADSTWALPTSGITGSQCFYSCRSLVGGNGTSWSSSNVNYTYMRIDKAGQAGYPTAA